MINLSQDLIDQLHEKIREQENTILMLKNQNIELRNLCLEKQTTDTISLQQIIAHMPGNVFWKDINGFYLGCNNNHAKLAGFNHPDEIIGKRNQHFLSNACAETIDATDRAIMESCQENFLEEEGEDIHGN